MYGILTDLSRNSGHMIELEQCLFIWPELGLLHAALQPREAGGRYKSVFVIKEYLYHVPKGGNKHLSRYHFDSFDRFRTFVIRENEGTSEKTERPKCPAVIHDISAS